MGVIHKEPKKIPVKKSNKRVARIKVEFDKELEVLSGTILFPQKLASANKFLSATK